MPHLGLLIIFAWHASAVMDIPKYGQCNDLESAACDYRLLKISRRTQMRCHTWVCLSFLYGMILQLWIYLNMDSVDLESAAKFINRHNP